MARTLTYSARQIVSVGTLDGHWVLVKTNNETVVADGAKFIVRISGYNIPIFFGPPSIDGTYRYGLSVSNGDFHRQVLEDAYPGGCSDIVKFLNDYINDWRLNRVHESSLV
jgi:hypothetical protein